MVHHSEGISLLQETTLEVLWHYIYFFLRRKLSEIVNVTTVIE
jgi:hypothetical protein